jgi:putative FmdB family regulatory protein
VSQPGGKNKPSKVKLFEEFVEMPMYSYKCQKCEHEYELFYKTFSAVEQEEPEEKCPKCDATEKERLISTNTTFILKGRGWAKDKYS